MIELMIVVIIVGILAASAVPLYRGALSRAYEAEVLSALGTLRSAQRMFYAEHDRYANIDFADVEEDPIMDGTDYFAISTNDFDDMSYVSFGEFSVSSDGSVGWTGSISGYEYTSVSMSATGVVTRSTE